MPIMQRLKCGLHWLSEGLTECSTQEGRGQGGGGGRGAGEGEEGEGIGRSHFSQGHLPRASHITCQTSVSFLFFLTQGLSSPGWPGIYVDQANLERIDILLAVAP